MSQPRLTGSRIRERRLAQGQRQTDLARVVGISPAYLNLIETMPAFAALVLIVLYTGNASPTTALGAQIYFWGRVLYFPAYLAGIPFVRTIIWVVSTAGLVMILWDLLKLAF